MRMMGEQFVSGQTISAALASSRKYEERGFSYSYDMLGEAATTAEDAHTYFKAYEQAIHAIGKWSQGRGIYEGPGISIKLSALHARYSRTQRERVMTELYPRLLSLTVLARQYDIGINIDAEEADRLELSLDLLEKLCFEVELEGWNGIGFVVQAYQKRAPFVLDYVIDLARRSRHRLMLRLVKGAYWDTEIKRSQEDGLEGYPVYTRKVYTDVSYLACARKLLGAPEAVFPQFATHNAHTLSAIYYMAGQNYYPGQYEFQCLHGMGENLYDEVVGSASAMKLNRPCRIYAPVGSHDTLLAYLVRRLLENGANTSFVNQVSDEAIPIERLIADPVEQALAIRPVGKPHEKIPLPADLYREQGRINSSGVDLSNEHRLSSLSAALLHSVDQPWHARAIVGDGLESNASADMAAGQSYPVRNPANRYDVVGQVQWSTNEQIEQALTTAQRAAPIWQSTPVSERAQALRRAAQLIEDSTQPVLGVLIREAGKGFESAVNEVREAIDFLRYYANQAEQQFSNDTHRALGPVLCISPWNFPLAIFLGQISAALAAGNVVIAKPAEQTNLIAYWAVQRLHEAGVAPGAVQLLPGDGDTVGSTLVADTRIKGVMFTGSTEVARAIARTLGTRLDVHGRPIPLIAETGGLNAMVVDSSALAEQVVGDVLSSAFDSAGQRCSALRLLCIQSDCADRVFQMLKGAMNELRVGNPDTLACDVGPVIDVEAQTQIESYIQEMKSAGHRVHRIETDPVCRQGTFIAPALIELDRADQLKREVFGPVLHILRYQREELDALIDTINERGYGLTFGVHTRLDETVKRVTERIKAGNIYVNRNIVGAVVGVQPFGGEGLSGTGPKAGGPLYMYRLLSQSPSIENFSFSVMRNAGGSVVLPGPTGEINSYRLLAKGTVLCVASTERGLRCQFDACESTGNHMLVLENPFSKAWVAGLSAKQRSLVSLITELEQSDAQAVLFEGDPDELQALQVRLLEREGALLNIQGLGVEEIKGGSSYRTERLLKEVSTSVNTTAAGGNASLMMVG